MRSRLFLFSGPAIMEPDKNDVERTLEDGSGRHDFQATVVRRGMPLSAAVTIALILYTVVRGPALSIRSAGMQRALAAGIGIATVYGLIGRYAPGLRGLRDP